MSNALIDVIMQRRSVRAYQDKPVSMADLQQIVTCAINAPSARNMQPWRIAMVTDAGLLNEMNAAACRAFSADRPEFAQPGATIFYGAPAVLFVAGRKDSTFSGIDCGHLTENACIAAQALGLGTVIAAMWRGAFAGPEAKGFMEKLGFSDEYEFKHGISIGYAAQQPDARERDASLVTWVG